MPRTIDRILTEKARFIPSTGFNLVGLDDFEDFGDKLYLIGHFATRELAEAAMAAHRAAEAYPDRMFVYASTDA